MVVVTLDHVLEVSGAGGFMTSATDPSLCHGGGVLERRVLLLANWKSKDPNPQSYVSQTWGPLKAFC